VLQCAGLALQVFAHIGAKLLLQPRCHQEYCDQRIALLNRRDKVSACCSSNRLPLDRVSGNGGLPDFTPHGAGEFRLALVARNIAGSGVMPAKGAYRTGSVRCLAARASARNAAPLRTSGCSSITSDSACRYPLSLPLLTGVETLVSASPFMGVSAQAASRNMATLRGSDNDGRPWRKKLINMISPPSKRSFQL